MNETMKNLEIAKNNGVECITRELDTVDENGNGINIIHLNQKQEFVKMPNNLYEYFGDKGWTAGIQPEPYIFTDDEYSMGTMTTDKNMLFRLANVYSWGYTFLVVYPDRTWRFLGYWEYAQYGLKKYIPTKIQGYLKRDGLL